MKYSYNYDNGVEIIPGGSFSAPNDALAIKKFKRLEFSSDSEKLILLDSENKEVCQRHSKD